MAKNVTKRTEKYKKMKYMNSGTSLPLQSEEYMLSRYWPQPLI